MSFTTRNAWLLMVGALALGCSESATSQDETPDMAFDATVTPDAMTAADAEVIPDAEPTPDAALPDMMVPDAGPPRRALIERSPFGDDPAGNLVMNPPLEITSALAPIALPQGFGADHFVLPASPTRQPAVRLFNAEGLLISFQAQAGVLEASVWLGTTGDADLNRSVTLLALSRNEGEDPEGVSLSPEGGEISLEGLRQGKIKWQKYSGLVDVELLGQSYLLVDNPSGGEMWITGPRVSVMTTKSARTPKSASPLSPRLQAHARRGAELWAERQKKMWDRPAAEKWLIEQRHPRGEAPLQLLP
ncbi:MAG: hypothetical protein ACE366_16250 [Bradymonadia bacterium]